MARARPTPPPALGPADKLRLQAIVSAVEAGEADIGLLLDLWESLAIPVSVGPVVPAYKLRSGWITGGTDAVISAIRLHLALP